MALYTRTWTSINWFFMIIGSIAIYYLFVFIGNNWSIFKSYKTASLLLMSPLYYKLIFFFVGVIMFYELTYKGIERELFAPLYYYFNSIINRGDETDENRFFEITEIFHHKKNKKSRGKAKKKNQKEENELGEPLA